jgi:hypothetical protein
MTLLEMAHLREEVRNKKISRSMYCTTMIDPSKDIQVQMQIKLAAFLVDNSLLCFFQSQYNKIYKLNQQYTYVVEDSERVRTGERIIFLKELYSNVFDN